MASVDQVSTEFVVPRSHFLGDQDAPITVSLYSDFECQFCREFHQNVLPKLETDFINKGLVKYEIKHFPLINVHQFAFLAAKSTYCAGEQRQYWAYVDQLYAHRGILNKARLVELAELAEVPDVNRFSLCLEMESYDYLVRETLAEGAKKRIRGIPTVFIDQTYINGVPDYDVLKKVINNRIEEISKRDTQE